MPFLPLGTHTTSAQTCSACLNRVIKSSSVKSLAKLGEDITVHDLRRTFVSHLNALEPAPSKYTIKRLMNHRAREDVTDDYIQIEIPTLRAVITRLETEMVGKSQTT